MLSCYFLVFTDGTDTIVEHAYQCHTSHGCGAARDIVENIVNRCPQQVDDYDQYHDTIVIAFIQKITYGSQIYN